MLADGQTKPIQGAWRDILTRQLMGLTSTKIGCNRQQGCVEQNKQNNGKWQDNDQQQTVVLSAPAILEKKNMLTHVTQRTSTHPKRTAHMHAKRSDMSANKDLASIQRGVG